MGLGKIAAKALSYLLEVIWDISVLSCLVQCSVATLYRLGKEIAGLKTSKQVVHK
jgi:hypothetical protein